MTLIGTDLSTAIKALTAGKLVGIPTETVYGLAANALDPEAVAHIFSAKERPSFHPLIVHIRDLAQAEAWVGGIPERIRKLTDMLWPGPLTVLLPRSKAGIPDIVTGGSPWVGLRVPQHPLTLQLLEELAFPLAAPSANRFGYVSPTLPEHVADQLGDKVAYILDGGPSKIGVESTIVLDASDEEPLMILRPGGVSMELLEYLVGPVQLGEGKVKVPSSGALKSHYATNCLLKVGEVEELLEAHSKDKVGIISFSQHYTQIPESQLRVLSTKGNLEEAAHRLFAAMRELDQMGLDVILVEVFPERGLGRAINDRLRKAGAAV